MLALPSAFRGDYYMQRAVHVDLHCSVCPMFYVLTYGTPVALNHRNIFVCGECDLCGNCGAFYESECSLLLLRSWYHRRVSFCRLPLTIDCLPMSRVLCMSTSRLFGFVLTTFLSISRVLLLAAGKLRAHTCCYFARFCFR